MEMQEEQIPEILKELYVGYKSKIMSNTIRKCFLTDRMVEMMAADFESSEILQKFMDDGYDEEQIKQTFCFIIRAGHTKKANNVKW